ncbi:MAG TPA: deoxyribonuclease IV [Acidimicrobiales bacterium]|nr:deoxyribonuclease IV [Acidimicrobiales bacterium]
MAVLPPIGAHVKTDDPLAVAEATGAGAVQLFLSDPQGWKKPQPRDDADALRNATIPVYVHAPYIVNLASPNNRIRIPSRKVLQQTCDAAAEIGARAVVVHGGHVTADETVEAGVERWVKGIKSLETKVPVYLENTAGGDHAMARHFDTIARLWDAIGDMGVGFCLDTCHTHAAGEEMVGAAERILAITGRIDLVHANDSKDAAGSGRDRHEHLGAGKIDPDVLVEVVRTAAAPVICETATEGVKDDIAFLTERLGG